MTQTMSAHMNKIKIKKIKIYTNKIICNILKKKGDCGQRGSQRAPFNSS
jgi:hypothetical protein